MRVKHRGQQTARNYSYLEHGYKKVAKETAQSILARMERVVATIAVKAGFARDPLHLLKTPIEYN